MCCKICKEKGGHSVYAKEGSENLKISAFHDHTCSSEHKNFCWALQSGGKVLEKAIKQGQRACDESLSSLFRAAYFIGKQFLPYAKFHALCSLFTSVKAPITTSLYHDEKSCADLIVCMSNVIKNIICRVRNFFFYGIMIDESTDISVTGHLVVFAIIIEEGMPLTVFLDLSEIEGGKKDASIIFYCLVNHLKIWKLDLCKCVAFGSDGASTMVRSHGGVATRLKNTLNPFVLSCHCIAHRTNLALLDASKASDCKVISDEVDTILNVIASYFNMSSKRKHALTTLQTIFFLC